MSANQTTEASALHVLAQLATDETRGTGRSLPQSQALDLSAAPKAKAKYKICRAAHPRSSTICHVSHRSSTYTRQSHRQRQFNSTLLTHQKARAKLTLLDPPRPTKKPNTRLSPRSKALPQRVRVWRLKTWLKALSRPAFLTVHPQVQLKGGFTRRGIIQHLWLAYHHLAPLQPYLDRRRAFLRRHLALFDFLAIRHNYPRLNRLNPAARSGSTSPSTNYRENLAKVGRSVVSRIPLTEGGRRHQLHLGGCAGAQSTAQTAEAPRSASSVGAASTVRLARSVATAPSAELTSSALQQSSQPPHTSQGQPLLTSGQGFAPPVTQSASARPVVTAFPATRAKLAKPALAALPRPDGAPTPTLESICRLIEHQRALQDQLLARLSASQAQSPTVTQTLIVIDDSNAGTDKGKHRPILLRHNN